MRMVSEDPDILSQQTTLTREKLWHVGEAIGTIRGRGRQGSGQKIQTFRQSLEKSLRFVHCLSQTDFIEWNHESSIKPNNFITHHRVLIPIFFSGQEKGQLSSRRSSISKQSVIYCLGIWNLENENMYLLQSSL